MLVLPVPLPVLAKLQEANLITRDECKGIVRLYYVLVVQSAKSPEVVLHTSEILRTLKLETESKFLAGKQMYSEMFSYSPMFGVIP